MKENDEKSFQHKRSIYGQWHRYDDTGFKEMEGIISDARGIDLYVKDLMISKEDLEGRDVLDLGAGPTAQLERDLKGIANVVSLSPDYSENELRNSLSSLQTVNSIGQDMPFPNACFDYVLIENVFQHHHELNDFLHLLKEAYRVIKPGGQVISGQISDYWKVEVKVRLLEGLKILGISSRNAKITFVETGQFYYQRIEGSPIDRNKIPIYCIKIKKRLR